MAIPPIPHLPNFIDPAAQAIVRMTEAQNAKARNQGEAERKAEAERQRAQRRNPDTSSR